MISRSRRLPGGQFIEDVPGNLEIEQVIWPEKIQVKNPKRKRPKQVLSFTETRKVLRIYNNGHHVFASQEGGKFHWIKFRDFQKLVPFGEVSLIHGGHDFRDKLHFIGADRCKPPMVIRGASVLLGVDVEKCTLYQSYLPRFIYTVRVSPDGVVLFMRNKRVVLMPWHKLIEVPQLPTVCS